MTRIVVIAEAGVNHNGDFGLARELVDAAADCGADIVKFQTFTASALVVDSMPKVEYQLETAFDTQSQLEMLRRLEMNHEMHGALVSHCSVRKIEFLSTGFDIHNLNYLVSLGISRIKVPSGEITNIPYLRHISTLGKDVILSTGMSTMDEVKHAIDAKIISKVSS